MFFYICTTFQRAFFVFFVLLRLISLLDFMYPKRNTNICTLLLENISAQVEKMHKKIFTICIYLFSFIFFTQHVSSQAPWILLANKCPNFKKREGGKNIRSIVVWCCGNGNFFKMLFIFLINKIPRHSVLQLPTYLLFFYRIAFSNLIQV